MNREEKKKRKMKVKKKSPFHPSFVLLFFFLCSFYALSLVFCGENDPKRNVNTREKKVCIHRRDRFWFLACFPLPPYIFISYLRTFLGHSKVKGMSTSFRFPGWHTRLYLSRLALQRNLRLRTLSKSVSVSLMSGCYLGLPRGKVPLHIKEESIYVTLTSIFACFSAFFKLISLIL